MKRLFGFVLSLGLVAVIGLPAAAAVNSVTPSTNDINKTNGWAHYVPVNVAIGEVTVDFISTRGFASCFEYRSDGDTSQKIDDDNYNVNVTDGLYPFTCVANQTKQETLYADEYVEIRMVFGAETDERFDWTRIDVLPDAQTKADCKDGGWKTYGFENQGQCVRFIETGKDSRVD